MKEYSMLLTAEEVDFIQQRRAEKEQRELCNQSAKKLNKLIREIENEGIIILYDGKPIGTAQVFSSCCIDLV